MSVTFFNLRRRAEIEAAKKTASKPLQLDSEVEQQQEAETVEETVEEPEEETETAEAETTVGHLDENDLLSYKKADLQELARELGVSDEGTVKELAARCASVEVEVPAE